MQYRLLAPAALLASLWVAVPGCNSAGHRPARPAPQAQTVATAPVAHRSTAPATAPVATMPAAPATRAETAPAGSAQQMLGYLASDALEGRGVGTKGLDEAADFIAAQFKQAGLRPMPGLDGYFQTFEMTTATRIADGTGLSIGDRALKLDRDFRPLGFSAAGPVEGPVVFAGYGITSEEFNYDDYAGIDVKDKVVLVMRFEPHSANGKSRFKPESYSENATLYQKAKVAADHGAKAILLVTPKKFHADELMPFVGRFMDGRSRIPAIQIRQAVAEAMLQQAGAADLASLQASIDEEGKPSSIALKSVSVSGAVAFDRETTDVKNVVGLLKSPGPKGDEYVVIGAHYDHLGMGGGGEALDPGVKAVHNGADDNASGTTVVMELARDLAAGGSLDRSVIFVAFTGEESGLLGSKQFVEHPPVPLEKIVAMLNLDMVGRVRDETLFIGGGGTAAPFQKILQQVDDASPLKFKDIGKGGFGPSDHMSFAMHKIPVLFFFSGLHGDYHRATDDADKINYEGLQQVESAARQIARAVAAMPKAAYIASADAKSYSIGSPAGGRHVTLGVVPDYGSDITAGGVRISGAVEGSPAEKAGLAGGDVIIGYNDRSIDNLYDLSAALAASKPGDHVTLKVKRNDKTLELTATLAAKAG